MGLLPNGLAQTSRLWMQVAQIAFESQVVISFRVAGMMGILPQQSNESHRMVQEKLDAAQEAGFAMFRAATRGASADKIMSAALRPYRRRTKANARRLTKPSSLTRG